MHNILQESLFTLCGNAIHLLKLTTRQNKRQQTFSVRKYSAIWLMNTKVPNLSGGQVCNQTKCPNPSRRICTSKVALSKQGYIHAFDTRQIDRKIGTWKMGIGNWKLIPKSQDDHSKKAFESCRHLWPRSKKMWVWHPTFQTFTIIRSHHQRSKLWIHHVIVA